MKKNIIYILILVIILLIFILLKFNNSVISVSSNNIANDKKVCWGLVRKNNNEQPDFHKPDTNILDKYNGIYVGNNEKKYLYLTFDEGYENGYTAQILDVLKQNNVKAAFFITSDYLKTSSDLVKRIIDEGHILGNHTNKHPSLPSLINEKAVKDELIILEQKVMDDYGYKMEFFRPPKGEYNEFSMKCINELGYTTVMWSFAYDDWNVNSQKGEEYAKQKIIDNFHPGSIMLLHAVSKDNANVLDYVIKNAIEQGYEFKSLDEFER